MRARRTWKVVGAGHHHSTIEELQLDLPALNRCIAALEKAEVDPGDVESRYCTCADARRTDRRGALVKSRRGVGLVIR